MFSAQTVFFVSDRIPIFGALGSESSLLSKVGSGLVFFFSGTNLNLIFLNEGP